MRLLLLIPLLCAGCSFSAVQHRDISAVNVRWLWQTEGFELRHADTVIKLQRSNPDAQTAEAIAAGVTRGLTP